MNEQVKALAEEAVNAVQSRPNGICDMNKYNQKFAELIVKECIRIMKQNEMLPVGVVQAKSADIHSTTLYNYFGV